MPLNASLLALICAATGLPQKGPTLSSRGLSGYISMSATPPPEGFGYGVSLYTTAWPLLERPIRDFQIGLASIWIIPDNRNVEYSLLPKGTVARDNWPERGPSYRDVFQTIEGGLGFWVSTRFGSATAKFRMNGTPNGYNHEISSPGWGFGRVMALKKEEMGIAQLSPYLLVPPDGLTFKEGTNGELLGYAWMALPLTHPKTTTAGLKVTTGNQNWTMFLNTTNFRGPVAFYTPATWSRISRIHPPAIGRGLDEREGLVTGGAIEVNTVPLFTSKDGSGNTYTKIPKMQFPVDKDGRTILIHNLTHYSKDALYNQFRDWIGGGPEANSLFDKKGASLPTVDAHPLTVNQGPENLPIRGVENWVSTKTFGDNTFGLLWKTENLKPWVNGQMKGSFPEFFLKKGKEFQAIPDSKLPAETGLAAAVFPGANKDQAYFSPSESDSIWKSPGPAAGPFKVKLTDGSVVTYYWYKFINQPALQDADLTDREKARLQMMAEKIQASWTPEKQYMAPPSEGRIASLDPALIVKPPKNLGLGYVPIVTNQSEPAAVIKK